MKDRVIIYGMGEFYYNNIEFVESMYDVVAVTDTNKRIEGKNFILPEDIAALEEWDFVVVACQNFIDYVSVINDLTGTMGVPKERIRVLVNEINKNVSRLTGVFRSFAQFGEDYCLFRLIKDRMNDFSSLNYAEFGVCDPININNTYFMHLMGANGFLVEADPMFIPAIEVVRDNQKVYNVAVVDDDKTDKVLFYRSSTLGWSSLDKDSLVQGIVDEIMIDGKTVNELFSMFGTHIHVVSIDLEGLDEAVLYSIDYKKYCPEIIISETRGGSDCLKEYMNDVNYCHVYTNGINDIWCRKE